MPVAGVCEPDTAERPTANGVVATPVDEAPPVPECALAEVFVLFPETPVFPPALPPRTVVLPPVPLVCGPVPM